MSRAVGGGVCKSWPRGERAKQSLAAAAREALQPKSFVQRPERPTSHLDPLAVGCCTDKSNRLRRRILGLVRCWELDTDTRRRKEEKKKQRPCSTFSSSAHSFLRSFPLLQQLHSLLHHGQPQRRPFLPDFRVAGC